MQHSSNAMRGSTSHFDLSFFFIKLREKKIIEYIQQQFRERNWCGKKFNKLATTSTTTTTTQSAFKVF